jgi:MSHA biogenesis protein MshP
MVAVIAVLAMLAVFGASVVVISTSQQIGAALDLQGVRAYHAARGGVEWGLYQVLRNGQDCAGINQTIAYGDGLTGFSVSVTCLSSTHPEGSSVVTFFTITATGCNAPACPAAPAATYVERQLRVRVARD